jgi:hypothetical protein
MGAIAVAFGASVAAGVGGGIFGATRQWTQSVRPRRFVREHRPAFEGFGFVLTMVAVGVAALTVAGADVMRFALGVSCAAAGVLLAVASWLLLIESDDDDEPNLSPEPSWWPEFERELDEWSRGRTLSRMR